MFATVMFKARWKISPYKDFIIQGHTFVKTCIFNSRLFLRQVGNVYLRDFHSLRSVVYFKVGQSFSPA